MNKYAIMMLFLSFQTSIAMELELLDRSKRHASIQDKSSQERPLISKKSKENSKRFLGRERQVTKYCTETLPSLQIAQIRESFAALPVECKHAALATMSTRMQLMHAVATVLPGDVIKQILFFMLDKHKQAAEKFYNKPIGKAFELYHTIKSKVNNDCMPVGPLYAQTKIEREFVLQINQPGWLYSQPIITIADQERIVAMSEELQQYFVGKQVKVLPSAEQVGFTKEIISLWGGILCGIAFCANVSIFGCGALICGVKTITSPSFFITVPSVSCGIPIGLGTFVTAVEGGCKILCNTQDATL